MSWRPNCAVAGCPNKGIHSMPENKTVQQLWFRAYSFSIQPKGEKMKRLRKRPLICSNHFKETDFFPALMDVSSQIIMPKKLKPHAVPSVFPTSSVDALKVNENNEIQDIITSSNIGKDKTFLQQGTEFKKKNYKILNEVLCLDLLVEVHKLTLLVLLAVLPANADAPACSNMKIQTPASAELKTYKIHFKNQMVDQYVYENLIFIDKNCGTNDTEENLNHQYYTKYNYLLTVDKTCQTNENVFDPDILTLDKSCQTDKYVHPAFCIETYEHDDQAIHFYTGLENYRKLVFTFQTLGHFSCLHYVYGPPPKEISYLNQFFMTLIILRQHLTFQQMSMMFRIHIKQIYNIFITWVRLMALQWRRIDIWPDRDTVHALAPLDFFDKYPMTRVIIDATEFPIQKPKLPLAQQITFSSYKNRNTAKVLIGITPGGLISYVSPTYGGSATDRQIIERSAILNRFDYKDEIMVDKGLNVQDILIGYGVKVNMPSFFKKANQIAPNTLLADRNVASKRVHVERVIGMLKTYKILKQPMNRTEILLCRDIVFVCCMLVNFRSNIINNTA